MKRTILAVSLAAVIASPAFAGECPRFKPFILEGTSYFNDRAEADGSEWSFCSGTGYTWYTAPGSKLTAGSNCRTIAEQIAIEDTRSNEKHRERWITYWQNGLQILRDYRAATGQEEVHGRKLWRWWCANR